MVQPSESFFEKLSHSVRGMLGIEQTEPIHPAHPLPSTDPPPIATTAIKSGTVVINGVELPELVVMQLKMLGVPLANYNGSELKDAVNACAVDCTLIDDDDGLDFRDKLTLNDDEREGRSTLGKVKVLSMENFGVSEYGGAFTNRLRMERIREFAHGLTGPSGPQFALP